MAGLNVQQHSIRSGLPKAAYFASVVLFLWLVSGFYLPGKGFSALLLLGDKMVERALPEFIATGPHAQPNSYGYDGQFYAQLAVEPDLRNPDLVVALDSLPYRARRILLSWTAWVVGGGDAARVVQVFAIQNVACWLALALVLLRWFPATSWENYFRWASVLFCYGLCFSVRASLLDGPSLLLIAVGVIFFEKGRPWWSASVLAVSGLVRETNVIAASVLATPGRKTWAEWGGVVARGVLVAVPCGLWVLYLTRVVGSEHAGGSGNFSLPLEAYAQKVGATLADIRAGGWNEANFSSVTMLVALTVQAGFLALRPRWSEPWWRIGLPYLVLMVALGEAMWEGYPGAAARALLPMGLAFNVLVPRGRKWWAVVALGNATMLSAFGVFQVPADQCHKLTAVPELAISSGSRRPWKVAFDDNWYGPERSRAEYWSWSRGTARVSVHNPHAFPLLVDVTGGLKSLESRTVTLRVNGEALWSNAVGVERVNFDLRAVRFEPGVTSMDFQTDREARPPSSGDLRPLAFSVRDLHFHVISPVPAEPPPPVK